MPKLSEIKNWNVEIETEITNSWKSQEPFTFDPETKKKIYSIDTPPPYINSPIHMGHAVTYSFMDMFARYKRMKGYNVLYPMGYDSFGLPAENAAIKKKADPALWTEQNIEGQKNQQKLLGLSYDWGREIATCHDDYYRWNQWIFLKFLDKGLAYKKKSFVNWCPDCNTVLANEQVHDGKCWRCSANVDQRNLEQWKNKMNCTFAIQ